jgi:REP element-mobilizing transposase RayT
VVDPIDFCSWHERLIVLPSRYAGGPPFGCPRRSAPQKRGPVRHVALGCRRHAAPGSLGRPGTLQHMMVRGLEQRTIFPDDTDGEEFLARLVRLVPETWTACCAWVLMPKHVHLLLLAGRVPPSTLMRRLRGVDSTRCADLGSLPPSCPLRRPAGPPCGHRPRSQKPFLRPPAAIESPYNAGRS